VIAELESSAAGVWHETLRWETNHHFGPWFPWSRVGADAIGDLAQAAGLVVSTIVDTYSRVIAVLTVPNTGDA
jgi:hypothetical protein